MADVFDEDLIKIYDKTIAIFQRFVTITAKEINHEIEDAWNVLSPNLIQFCDEHEKLLVRKSVFEKLMASFNDQADYYRSATVKQVLEKYENEIEAECEKLKLGDKTNGYNSVKSLMMTELSEQLEDTDIVPVAENCTYLDPFTKLRLIDPVKNIRCGHVYERKIILELLSEKSIKCPIAGCILEHQVDPSDLVTDMCLRKLMDQNKPK